MLLYGGLSSEREISLLTGINIAENLNRERYKVTLLDTGKRNWQEALIKQRKDFDLAFIALHGKFGEDGTVQGFLGSVGLPYTGSGVLASALAMNKLLSRRIFQKTGLKTPPFFVLEFDKFKQQKNQILTKIDNKIGFPCVIKPNNGGSSLGVYLIKNTNELKQKIIEVLKYDKTILVEKYLKGKEITVGILGNCDNPISLVVLPLVEIIPRPKYDFFDYEAKYQNNASEEIVPARISRALTRKIQKIALRGYLALNCCGFARFDFILVKNIPYLLEANTIPGMTENSLFPKAAKAYGLSFPQLLEQIIALAV